MNGDEGTDKVFDENDAGFWNGAAEASKPKAETPAAPGPGGNGYPENVQRIMDFQLPVTVSFGSTKRTLGEILRLAPGALIELDKGADDPVVLKVNDRVFAWGKVVEIDGYYGIEITEVVNRRDRINSLGGF